MYCLHCISCAPFIKAILQCLQNIKIRNIISDFTWCRLCTRCTATNIVDWSPLPFLIHNHCNHQCIPSNCAPSLCLHPVWVGVAPPPPSVPSPHFVPSPHLDSEDWGISSPVSDVRRHRLCTLSPSPSRFPDFLYGCRPPHLFAASTSSFVGFFAEIIHHLFTVIDALMLSLFYILCVGIWSDM